MKTLISVVIFTLSILTMPVAASTPTEFLERADGLFKKEAALTPSEAAAYNDRLDACMKTGAIIGAGVGAGVGIFAAMSYIGSMRVVGAAIPAGIVYMSVAPASAITIGHAGMLGFLGAGIGGLGNTIACGLAR